MTQSQLGLLIICTTALTVSAQWYFNVFLDAPRFFFFFPAALFVAWFGNFRSALITIILCSLSADYLFFDPKYNLFDRTPVQLVPILLAALCSAFGAKLTYWLQHKEKIAQLSQQRFHTTLTSIGEAVIVVDAKCLVRFVNSTASKLLGWSNAEARGCQLDDIFKIINEESRDPALNLGAQVIEDGVPAESVNQTLLISRTGEERPIALTATPIFTEDNPQPSGAVIVFRDISDQDITERTLNQLFNESPSFIAFLSVPDYRYEKANQEHDKLIGRRDYVGKRIVDVFPEVESQGFINLLDKVVATKKRFVGTEVPLTIKTSDGKGIREQYVDFVYQPLTNASGVVYGVAAQGYDVTEKVLARKRLEEAKRGVENERLNLRNLFKETPDLLCVLAGPEHRFEFVNESHINILGFDATGKTLAEAQPESVEVHDIIDNVYKTGITEVLVELPITVTDRLRYFNLTGAARRDSNGRIDGVMVLGTEITNQVLARHQLEESQKRFRHLAETIPVVVWTSTPNGSINYYNRKWFEYTGLSPDFPRLEGWKKSVPEEERRVFSEGWNAALNDGVAFEQELRIRSRFGEYRWHVVRVVPIKDASGVVVEWFGTITDIHEHKIAHSRLQSFVDTIPIFAGIVDKNGILKLVNQIAVNAIEEKKENVLGRPFWNGMWWDELPEVVSTLKESIKKAAIGIPQRFDTRYVSITQGKPSLRWVDLSIMPTFGSSGDIDGLTVTGFDITERVLQANELAAAKAAAETLKAEAERANQLKSAFLANMSHEIRTPLGAMLGFANLLKDPSASEAERVHFAEILNRNGEQLTHIIDDILDLSKVEAGHLELLFEPVNIGELIDEVVSLFSVTAREKGLELRVYKDSSLPGTFVTDGSRVRQILSNLIGNAIKFTKSGFVELRCFGFKNDAGVPAIKIEIRDTGVGIAPESVSRLFKIFSQADVSMTRQFGGTGLGLALSRALANLLGGNLVLKESVRNQGSTFELQIFERSASLKKIKDTFNTALDSAFLTNQPTLSDMRILLADDSVDNQQLISRLLKKEGAIVEVADNGQEAVERARQGKHDVVLMDLQMPVMDGYTATQTLRKIGYECPIIALTAHAMIDVQRECFNVGCDGHLPKPIKLDELIKTLRQWKGRRHPQPSMN